MKRKCYLLVLSICFFHYTSEAQSSRAYQQIITDLHERVNDYRRSIGLGEMELSGRLSDIALQHSRDMAADKVPFSHTGFNRRMQKVKSLYNGPFSFAENLYMTNNPHEVARFALKGWINSPGHHKNLKGQWSRCGIGIARNRRGEFYVTQVYFGPYGGERGKVGD